MSTNSYFLVPFFGTSTIDDAERVLRAARLMVEREADELTVRWNNDNPAFYIGLNHEPYVRLESRELAEDFGCFELARCDRRFEVAFDDLDEVLDEINTLIEVQGQLQDLTGGCALLTWNGELLPPYPSPKPPWSTPAVPPGLNARIVDAGPTRFVDMMEIPTDELVAGSAVEVIRPLLAGLPAIAHVAFVAPADLARALAGQSADALDAWWRRLRAAVPSDAVTTCFVVGASLDAPLISSAERADVIVPSDWPRVLATDPTTDTDRLWSGDEILRG